MGLLAASSLNSFSPQGKSNLILRSSSVYSTIISRFFLLHGADYLRKVVWQAVRKAIDRGHDFEIERSRVSSHSQLAKNAAALLRATEEVFSSIVSLPAGMP